MQTPVSSADGTSAADDDRPVNPKQLLPRADASLFDVGKAVETHWATLPALTLQWLTPAAYSTALAEFGTQFTEKRRVATERSPGVQRLIELDDQADDALPFLLGYIDEEAGSKVAGRAQYASHGVEKKGKRYRLPIDRQERIRSVDALLARLKTGGPESKPMPYAARKFGAAFWDKWLQEYRPLVNNSGEAAGTFSHRVSRKNAARQTVRKALRAIIFLLKANYPDTFAAELRAWGFRKESY